MDRCTVMAGVKSSAHARELAAPRRTGLYRRISGQPANTAALSRYLGRIE
jgi:hypothetical protein